MVGINSAIKTTGVTGGTKNSAKPGSLGAKNNNNKGVSKLSAVDISEAEKKIKEGEDTGEVASTDEEKNTGETTTSKTSSADAAKKAVETPRDRLNSHIEKMGEAIDAHREKMANASQGPQALAAQNEQAKLAEMMAMANQKGQATPKASTPSTPKSSTPQKKSSTNNSTNDALKKLAESHKTEKAKTQKQMKENEERMLKMAKALKEAKQESPEKSKKDTVDKAKETLVAKQDSARSQDGAKVLEGSGKAVSTEDIMKLDKYVDDVMATNKSPEKDTALLEKLDKLAEKADDKNIDSIRDDFKSYVEGKSESRSVDADRVQDFSSQKDLEDYDSDNSFNLNNELPRSEDGRQSFEQHLDQVENTLDDNLDKTLEETQEAVEEQASEEIEEDIQEQIEEDISAEIDEMLEELE